MMRHLQRHKLQEHKETVTGDDVGGTNDKKKMNGGTCRARLPQRIPKNINVWAAAACIL